MKLYEVIQKLDAEEVIPPKDYEADVKNVCASDLLSDILATDKEEFIILTGLTTPQVIRTAEIVGALAIIIVRGKYLPQEFIGVAQAHNIPIFQTKFPMFESCVKLGDLLDERDKG
ncbi:TPA: hypothetical protein EYP37_12060 [Candidatus Poribacteria bacterium]|nr:hypothetical protein [Candidatus Poribacteria bacterium]